MQLNKVWKEEERVETITKVVAEHLMSEIQWKGQHLHIQLIRIEQGIQTTYQIQQRSKIEEHIKSLRSTLEIALNQVYYSNTLSQLYQEVESPIELGGLTTFM